MKCLVTGGAGFIGSNLAIELEKQGHKVTVVDNFFTGTKDNLRDFKGKIVERDISKPFSLEGSFDLIFHQAAITDPRFGNDEEMMRSNLEGFKNIIALAHKHTAKLIYASSASMYGNGPAPQREDQKKDLLSAYAESKLAMDTLAEEYFDKMHIIGLRYFNVFGPREAHKGRPASMIFHLRNQIKEGKHPKIFKMGEQKRDHIYVKDAVDATVKSITASKSGVYNVGTGQGIDFNEVVAALNETMGTKLGPEYINNPYEGTYQNHTQADTTKTQQFLSWKVSWNFRDAVKDYVGWLDEQS